MIQHFSTSRKSYSVDNALYFALGYIAVSFIITHNYKLCNSCTLVLWLHISQYNLKKPTCLKLIIEDHMSTYDFYLRNWEILILIMFLKLCFKTIINMNE